ncbi:hypothetical protein GCM10010195_55050 [Kitasatospora griseola]|nr:hypothetical protein GCM10010195_55050 [Kitasatospora griseola]
MAELRGTAGFLGPGRPARRLVLTGDAAPHWCVAVCCVVKPREHLNGSGHNHDIA